MLNLNFQELDIIKEALEAYLEAYMADGGAKSDNDPIITAYNKIITQMENV